MGKENRLYEQAKRVIPGGVHSPVRSFQQVGGHPRYWLSSKGAYLVDADHRMVLDYVLGFGPHLLGHGHEAIVDAVCQQAKKGMLYGGCHPQEITLCEKIQALMPSMQKIRLVNSGTEAVMTAIRLARHVTSRRLVLRFNGHYHGHVDDLLEQAVSEETTPEAAKHHLDQVHAEFNNLASVEHAFSLHPKAIAAVIVEPVAGNMGCVLPQHDFLQSLAKLTRAHGAIFILDEVMTGFRVAKGGAQSVYDIVPDLTVLGKVVGGGLPVGAVGGCSGIMEKLAPSGPVYQAGTFSGNPMTVAAGDAMLSYIMQHADVLYPQLSAFTEQLGDGLQACARKHGFSLSCQSIGGMLGVFFSPETVSGFLQVKKTDAALYKTFFHHMLAQGVMLPPSPYEAWFVSSCHQANEMHMTLEAARQAFAAMANGTLNTMQNVAAIAGA